MEELKRILSTFATPEELLNPSRDEDEDMPDAGPVKADQVCTSDHDDYDD